MERLERSLHELRIAMPMSRQALSVVLHEVVRRNRVRWGIVYLQIGRAIIPHMGVARAYEMTRRIAERSNADVVIHLDHGSWQYSGLCG